MDSSWSWVRDGWRERSEMLLIIQTHLEGSKVYTLFSGCYQEF